MSENQDYIEKHHLSHVLKDALLALCEKRPRNPYMALSKGFAELQNFVSLDSAKQEIPFKEIFLISCEAADDGAVQGHRQMNGDSLFKTEENHSEEVIAAATVVDNSRLRRGSVSAESYNPPGRGESRKPSVVIPKSKEQKERIELSVSRNLLFKNLDSEQKVEIIDAMFEKRVSAGTAIIVQGDEGDNFYIVDKGLFSVLVNDKEVVRIGPTGSFGELALLYNARRSATVIAIEDSIVWGVDRQTFQRVIIDHAHHKRLMYEDFLKGIPLLGALKGSEVTRIADALQPVDFKTNDVIVRQGEAGDRFYIVERGELVVRQHPVIPAEVAQSETNLEIASEVEIGRLKRGDYFGELALLNNAPRAASVIALTDTRCVTLSVSDFIRCLGPVMDILRRNEQLYKRYEDIISSK